VIVTETVLRDLIHTDDPDDRLSVFFFDDGLSLEEDNGKHIVKISHDCFDKIIKARQVHFDNQIRMQEALKND
jgi:hypothetical protein